MKRYLVQVTSGPSAGMQYVHATNEHTALAKALKDTGHGRVKSRIPLKMDEAVQITIKRVPERPYN